MLIHDIFQTAIEDKIEPVIKVGERQDERKLASEIGSYVVTFTIEKWLDDFLEHYTDTLLTQTGEIGVWISGYFGSGKSHLAKIAALLVENRTLDRISATSRFEARIATSSKRDSIKRSLTRLNQCNTRILAFNLNTLVDSKSTSLPRLLLSQFYQAKGYGGNLIYARVIEAELDKRGKLEELHTVVERIAKKTWAEIQKNLSFYSKALYQAACEVAPDTFRTPEEVGQALKDAEKGELYNAQFLIRAVLDELETLEKTTGKKSRMMFVLDEAGQWIEDDGNRLALLQAFVEEAAEKGQGKIWVVVTTHEDMGSIYKNVKKLETHGDFKKIEGRFQRHKWNLTTENIELVLEDRLFKKNGPGAGEVKRVYDANPGLLRDMGQLVKTSQKLPECSEERFTTFYPFFPYQIHLIPEIVKSMRSAGGRGEQLAGSTRTLLAITQDIMRAGRRNYLQRAVGEMVSFDEVYYNLESSGEINPDVRREISRIQEAILTAEQPTKLTRRVAEVLYLIHNLTYIPRTIENVARLLAEDSADDLVTVRARVEPELKKLITAKLVAKLGEEYEFLTGERRTFEQEVSDEQASLRRQDLEKGLAKFVSTSVLGFEKIPFKGSEFSARIYFDETAVTHEGKINLYIFSPLEALSGTKVTDLEDRSLRPEEQQSIFVLCDRVSGFDENLKYYLAMQTVINRWKGDGQKSPDANKLVNERETKNLVDLKKKVEEGISEGLKRAQVVFRGSSHAVSPKPSQTPGETLRAELSTYWQTLYPKFEKLPVRIIQEQKAILDVLKGTKDVTSDVQELKLFDKAGQLDLNSPLLDAIRIYLSTRTSRKEHTLGKHLITEFTEPPYGWDGNAVRVGVAALVRSGGLRILINKKPYTNPLDGDLQDNLRVSKNFDKVELELEETDVSGEILSKVRSLLITLSGKRKIDETPAALAEELGIFGKDLLDKANKTVHWAEPADFPLPTNFQDGREAFQKIVVLTNPIHRVKELYSQLDKIEDYVSTIRAIVEFEEKWGKAYQEMRNFAVALSGVDYLLPSNGFSQGFLKNWEAATKAAIIAQKDVWNRLQSTKAEADLEVERAKGEWLDTARTQVQDKLAQLTYDIPNHKLDSKVGESLSGKLKTFLEQLEQEKQLAKIAGLPNRATKLVNEINDTIELAKSPKIDGGGIVEPPPSPKEVSHLKIATFTSQVPIKNLQEWKLILERMDQTVTRALNDGKEVDLS
ncbi:MAG: BREX system P-loop protein BrxC [Chloroflexota bacterium]